MQLHAMQIDFTGNIFIKIYIWIDISNFIEI